MTEFFGYLKEAAHKGRVIYIITVAVVAWFVWHNSTFLVLWFILCAGIILVDAVYDYVQVRVRKRVIQRQRRNQANQS